MTFLDGKAILEHYTGQRDSLILPLASRLHLIALSPLHRYNFTSQISISKLLKATAICKVVVRHPARAFAS